MIVGIVYYRFNYYPYRRNIVGILDEVDYKKVKDGYSLLNIAAQRLNRLAKREMIFTFDLNNQFQDFNLNKVDILHFFNGISYGKTPWVSTFETILPRFKEALALQRELNVNLARDTRSGEWKTRKALDVMAGNSCKRLIALSECNLLMQRNLLKNYSEYKETIESKLVVMHPPQELLVSHFSDKGIDLEGKIKFMFVGASFFRKGGMEIIETFKELRDKNNYDIELTLVSSLRIDNYATGEGLEDIKRAAQFISENSNWIKHIPHLPNKEVLSMMKQTHIGLLPTYADSYGYSVLEFQSVGCPVITTNVRALPEINNNEKGWLIEVPKDQLGEAIYTTTENKQSISSAIRAGLEKAVNEIFADRKIIAQKSEKAITGLMERHSISDYAARMQNIYLDATN
jgi:glycosyltransferase involved in cell wall biosynthesis